MRKIELEVLGLTSGHSQRSSYTLLLKEKDGQTKLPIVIGTYEAQAIALVMENVKPQRPLTHDLFKIFATVYAIDLKEVYIDNLVEGIFYAKLICNREGVIEEIDARTSDAIALALRFGCKIYTHPAIINEAGITLDDDDETENEEEEPKMDTDFDLEVSEDYSALSLKELEILLDDALSVEDYDKAAIIRDEINRRQ
jgi:uncharacterized protein